MPVPSDVPIGRPGVHAGQPFDADCARPVNNRGSGRIGDRRLGLLCGRDQLVRKQASRPTGPENGRTFLHVHPDALQPHCCPRPRLPHLPDRASHGWYRDRRFLVAIDRHSRASRIRARSSAGNCASSGRHGNGDRGCRPVGQFSRQPHWVAQHLPRHCPYRPRGAGMANGRPSERAICQNCIRRRDVRIIAQSHLCDRHGCDGGDVHRHEFAIDLPATVSGTCDPARYQHIIHLAAGSRCGRTGWFVRERLCAASTSRCRSCWHARYPCRHRN